MRFVKVLLYGNNQRLTRLVETGDLQPLQNLNQLTELNLMLCENLIGQSVFGFVREQPARDLIGRFLGTLAPLAGLSQLETLAVSSTNLTGQSESEICTGTTSAAFHSLSVSE